MLEITIDTNVFVSAFISKGNPLRLLELAADGEFGVAISQPILDETRRILGQKFGWRPHRIDAAETLINSFARRVEPSQTVRVVKDDASDDRIIECAVAAGSDYIITGDKHLLSLGRYEGIKMIRVADFLREIAPGRER